jgi:hypothetical protein
MGSINNDLREAVFAAINLTFYGNSHPIFQLNQHLYDSDDDFNGRLYSIYSVDKEWFYVVFDQRVGFRIYGPKAMGSETPIRDKMFLTIESDYIKMKRNKIKAKLTQEEIKLIKDHGL